MTHSYKLLLYLFQHNTQQYALQTGHTISYNTVTDQNISSQLKSVSWSTFYLSLYSVTVAEGLGQPSSNILQIDDIFRDVSFEWIALMQLLPVNLYLVGDRLF